MLKSTNMSGKLSRIVARTLDYRDLPWFTWGWQNKSFQQENKPYYISNVVDRFWHASTFEIVMFELNIIRMAWMDMASEVKSPFRHVKLRRRIIRCKCPFTRAGYWVFLGWTNEEEVLWYFDLQENMPSPKRIQNQTYHYPPNHQSTRSDELSWAAL